MRNEWELAKQWVQGGKAFPAEGMVPAKGRAESEKMFLVATAPCWRAGVARVEGGDRCKSL